MFTATLSLRQRVDDIDSLAYIESITDATNDIEQTENKYVKSANYHFNKFLCCACLCSLTVSAESTA